MNELSSFIVDSVNRAIKTWTEEYPSTKTLDLAQQIYLAAKHIYVIGNGLEVEYKKQYGKTTNELH
jgi:hypothetical protein